jgi:hypothetical protein
MMLNPQADSTAAFGRAKTRGLLETNAKTCGPLEAWA